MSATANRIGAPINPTSTTTGVPGTSDEVVTFLTDYVRPCVVTNTDTADPLYVLVNEEAASTTNFLVKLTAGQAVDVSFNGRLNVKSLSLFYASAVYSKAQVRGWKP